MFLYTNLVGQFTIRVNAKHLSKAWRATLQVGEVRILAFCPARHTEVDCLIKVQVIDFADCIPSAGTKAKTKNQKLTNVFCLPAFLPTCLLCVRLIVTQVVSAFFQA
jgi:hypothetical protein